MEIIGYLCYTICSNEMIMVLNNKLGITNEIEFAKEEKRITKIK